MKTIITLALVLLAGSAFATELKVPGKKLPPPLPVIQGETCMQRVERACIATHRTRLFTRACVFRNKYRCR